MDVLGGDPTRPPNDYPSNSLAATEQSKLLAPQLVLSELVATIGERWSVWDAAREEAQVALRK